MISCPFCDGQGLIYKARIKAKGIPIFICDECDTIWHEEDIREDNCDDFSDFMEKLGLSTMWEELENIERLQ